MLIHCLSVVRIMISEVTLNIPGTQLQKLLRAIYSSCIQITESLPLVHHLFLLGMLSRVHTAMECRVFSSTIIATKTIHTRPLALISGADLQAGQSVTLVLSPGQVATSSASSTCGTTPTSQPTTTPSTPTLTSSNPGTTGAAALWGQCGGCAFEGCASLRESPGVVPVTVRRT
ncbi:hypothetical protein BDQ17DRAFT_217684 [Cyathus striatus]|nr:hypothetical protein BDQ17DRAFT_217684 [Cyathus striatus]